MLISQLEAKIEAKAKQMHFVEDQILNLNALIEQLKENRNKLLEIKSDIWWEIEDIKEDIARLKEDNNDDSNIL